VLPIFVNGIYIIFIRVLNLEVRGFTFVLVYRPDVLLLVASIDCTYIKYYFSAIVV